jgi:hypothetical protein
MWFVKFCTTSKNFLTRKKFSANGEVIADTEVQTHNCIARRLDETH